MELSGEVQSLLEKFRLLKKQSEESVSNERSINQTENYELTIDNNDLIQLDEISFSTDEFWLHRSESTADPVKDINRWLSTRDEDLQDEYFHKQHMQMVREMAKINSHKLIDSRTFTRPKKKNTRPSLADFEGRNGIESADYLEMEPKSQPLSFDLSQPTSTSMFDSILQSAPEFESFQNMSPPSLVNSMCSSTFTNLMDNSYIKNDPILREIRDTDFSETILMQESGASTTYRSLCGSCNSFDGEETRVSEGAAEVMVGSVDESLDGTPNEFYSPVGSPSKEDMNGTYTKKEVLNTTITCKNATFDKTSRNNMTFSIDSLDDDYKTFTYNQQQPTHTTVSINRNNTFNKPRDNKDLSDSSLKYESAEDGRSKVTHTEVTDEVKTNSFGNLAGSADSLDRMSSLSDSSKGSNSNDNNRRMNMAKVDAIVSRQEMSLGMSSTPKTLTARLTPMRFSPISPVKSQPCSDSELSNEDYASVHTHLSTVSSLVSVADIRGPTKSLSTIRNERAGPSLLPARNAKGGSLTNLKSGGVGSLLGSTGNLKGVESMSIGDAVDADKTFKVPPPRGPARGIGDTVNVPSRNSLLPRPVTASTGIPRPVSRIPGPKSAIRSGISRTTGRPGK